MKIATLLTLTLLLTVGCKPKPQADICVRFTQKVAACKNVSLSDPRVAAAIEQCHQDRAAEGAEDADALAQDDARAEQYIANPCP